MILIGLHRLSFACRTNKYPVKVLWLPGKAEVLPLGSTRCAPLLICKQCVQKFSTSVSSQTYKFSPFSRVFFSGVRPVLRCAKRTNSTKVNSATTKNISKGTDKKKVAKISKQEFRRLLGLAKPERWKLAGAIALLLISSTVTMSVPFALGKVIDIIYTEDSEQMKKNLNTLCFTLLGVFILGGLCNFGRVYLMNVSGQRITRALRERVFGSIVKQEVAFFDQNRTGELINRLSTDTSVVSDCVTMNISDGLRSTVMVCAGVSMMNDNHKDIPILEAGELINGMSPEDVVSEALNKEQFYMSTELALVGLAIVPPIAAMAIVYGRFVRKITKNVQTYSDRMQQVLELVTKEALAQGIFYGMVQILDSLAEATQVAEERIGNIRTVKAFSQEQREMQTYSDRMQHVLELATKEALARGIFYGMTGLCGNVIILSVLYYGGVMVSDAHISVGSLSSFLLYAAYVGVSLGGLSSFYSELNRGLGASTRLWDLIDRVPAIPYKGGLVLPDPPQGDVVFDNVRFSYPARPDAPILQDLHLSIPSGKITAVVGASGSGKSTLAALLLRLYDPQQGNILLDGIPVSSYDPAWLRSHIGAVSQEPVLFSGTIRDNIIYGAEHPQAVSDNQVEWATREANAYNFITRDFPAGFDTRVGERGVMLSGGQKQRVAIARALIKNPRILLLDEATSALDAESEHLVQEALDRIMKGRTVLTIAHRLSTIINADQIAVLSEGKVVEIGSYDQLMAESEGAFQKLVKHQTFQA